VVATLAIISQSDRTCTITQLIATGFEYTNALVSAPSDSFPGILNQLTGAPPRTTGVLYNNPYGRSFFAPSKDPTVPDIIVTPQLGIIYTASAAGVAGHGGLNQCRRQACCVLRKQPVAQVLKKTKFSNKVNTKQVATTVLAALGRLGRVPMRRVQKSSVDSTPDSPHSPLSLGTLSY
jgi:hypothetical protein